jgi:two-component system, chemotaxis family, protein-glutamate methylesterase/glutaminase
MTDAREPAPERSRGAAVVVAGASAGGVEALVGLVRSLPMSFPHTVLGVLHVSPTGTSVLPAILGRACALPVSVPDDGEPLRGGHVYVAPPDRHLVVDGSRMRLSQAPRENGHRPAIDATMRTAAAAYGATVIGIVLSGTRDDGTAGLMAIKAGGGTAIVQDPEEALYAAMPRSAMRHVKPDAVLPVAEMAAWILANVPPDGPPGSDPPMPFIHDRALGSNGNDDLPRSATGNGTRFTCPDCGGVLFERHEGDLERFECSVGHVFSIESLSTAQAEALETALWAAVRALEDRAAMLRRLSDRARRGSHMRSAQTFERQAGEAVERARTIRDAIEGPSEEQAAAAGS